MAKKEERRWGICAVKWPFCKIGGVVVKKVKKSITDKQTQQVDKVGFFQKHVRE